VAVPEAILGRQKTISSSHNRLHGPKGRASLEHKVVQLNQCDRGLVIVGTWSGAGPSGGLRVMPGPAVPTREISLESLYRFEMEVRSRPRQDTNGRR